MPENILRTRIQQKIDTSANWASSNLILKDGEIGIERTTNNKTKIKIGDGINTWANLPYATNESSSSSGSGIEYEAGNGIIINDNVISSSYGELILQEKTFECLSLDNAESININKNFYYALEQLDENFKVNLCQIIVSPSYFSSVIKPFKLIFKKNNEIIRTINFSLGPQTIYENTENEMTFPYAAMGNEYFARALMSNGEDTEAITILTNENNPIPTSEWWIAAVLDDELTNGYYRFIYQAHEDILPLDIDTVTLELEVETFYKLPTNALTAGDGIKISEDATISLNYGQSDKKIFNTIFDASLDTTPPSNYYFGSLYGYYIQQSNFYAMEPNTYPGFFNSNLQGYTNYNSSLGNINKWSNSTYQETIDYDNNEYKQVPLYYYKDNAIPTEPNIILKEMQHQDNILYNFFEAGLDSTNPTMNIFFGGTYNTSQDVNTILSNQAIVPDNSNEPALLILFLYQSATNNAYLLIFTNNTNFDKEARISQGTWDYKFDHLPYDIFNGQNNINLGSDSNNSEAFIIGNNNQYLPGDENKTIIVGNNNNMSSLSPNYSAILLGNNLQVAGNNNQIIVGRYNNSVMNNSMSGDKLFIIGNGSSIQRSNILEVTSNGLNVNGTIYQNGNPLEGGGNGGIDQTALENYLQSNNYITNSYLSDNNYITSSDLSNYNYITSLYLSNNGYITSSYLSSNGYITNNDLASVATTGSYNDLSNRPSLATVATTGSYNDLSNKPTIPTVPTIATSITNTSTNTNTVGAAAVYNFVTNAVAGLSGAMHFIGTTTTALADGAITEPIVINSNNIYPVAGDVVLNNGNEYVYTGVEWHKLGDESSWVPQLRTINGKALSSNISLTASDVNALSTDTIFNLAEEPTSNNINNIQIYKKQQNGNIIAINHNPTENELFLYGPSFYKKIYDEDNNNFKWQQINFSTFTINSSSTNNQIPSAKAVYDLFNQFIEDVLEAEY